MNKGNEFYAYILGALLHDIGKFVQRAQENPMAMDHCKWGDKWFEERLSEKLGMFTPEEKDIIRKAINTHHDHMDLISLADALSAGMDRIELKDEEEKDPFTSRLKCIFSEISISNRKGEPYYYNLKSLSESLEEIFPIKEESCSHQEYSKLFEEFENEISKFLNPDFSPIQLIDTLYFLILNFAWAIPSSAYKDEPDISLFDHLKTTSAITSCLYLYRKEQQESLTADSSSFILLMGDVSGIQSYILDVLSQQGKVAKRLRARSLFVQLLSEVASHRIIHEFNLPYLNILSSAGGNFSILLPNLRDAKDRISKIEKEFDTWTYEKLGGELYVSLAFAEITGKELMNFSNVIENNLKPSLSQKKAQPFSSILKHNNSWETGKFLIERRIEGEEKACTGCRKYPRIDGEELCENCLMDIEVGRLLTNAKYIAFFKDSDSSQKRFPLLNYYIEIWDKRRDSSPYLVLSLNLPSSEGFKYIPNYIPSLNSLECKLQNHTHESGEPLSFECIAEFSDGDRSLGFLKGDADNMGKIFKEGFKNTKLTISRYCSLSRMLESFFSGYLNYKIRNEFKEIYTIFAGGDDFFITGPWDKVIDFAIEIRNDYSKFVGFNPDLTFSAGIIFAKHHEPISFCAEIAEEELKTAKKFEGKDSVRIFGKNLKWEELKEVLEEAKRVIDWMERKPPIISRGVAFNFREYGSLAEKSAILEKGKKIQTKYLRFVPLMVYDIERNLSSEEQKEAFEWAYSFLPNQKTPYPPKLRVLRIIMEYALKYTRGGE